MTGDRTENEPAKQAEGTRRVFFSYSRDDRERALPIIEALDDAGIDVWWDGLLTGGDRFAQTTENALETADAVLVLWTETSVNSHWVRDEATRGRDRGCMISLSVDGIEPPLGFRQIQYIAMSDWAGDAQGEPFQELMRAIEHVAAAPGTSLSFAPTHMHDGTGHGHAASARSVTLSRRSLLLAAGAVTVVAGGGYALWNSALKGPATADNSIAVMTFDNLSGDDGQDYFSTGLSEELRATLSLNRWLAVAARVSTESVQQEAETASEIAKALGVAYILEGSVRRSEDELRVTTRLINGYTGLEEWSRVFDRQMSNVLEVQEEIATQVVDELVVSLSADDKIDTQRVGGTDNPDALDSYLRGVDEYDRAGGDESNRLALAAFDRAIEIDQNYALAHAARSRALGTIGNTMASGKEVSRYHDQALAAAKRAIELAPDLADGHGALGFMLTNGSLDIASAREPYARSVELGFGNARILISFALFASFVGTIDEGRSAIERAARIDPLNPSVWRASAVLEWVAQNNEGASSAARKALSLSPGITIAHRVLGDVAMSEGRNEEARAHYQEESSTLAKLTSLAIVERRLGNDEAADEYFDQLIDQFGENGLYQQVKVLAQWGQPDRALDTLERAYANGDSGLVLSHTDTMLDPIRQQPRFEAIQRKLGFASIREN